LQAIGRSFNRYHATALHAISAIEKQIEKKSAIKQQVEILTGKLETGQFNMTGDEGNPGPGRTKQKN
jgi:chromosomal replication initiator protein